MMKIKLKIDDTDYEFTFRPIRMFEENAYWTGLSQFDNLSPAEKGDAEYVHAVSTLAGWAAEPVVKFVEELREEEVEPPLEQTVKVAKPLGDTPGQSVREFFKSLDDSIGERQALALITQINKRLQPKVVF